MTEGSRQRIVRAMNRVLALIPGIRHFAAVGLLGWFVVACGVSDATDPAAWLPSNLGGLRLSYTTYEADAFETRPVCACDAVIERAGGDLQTATVTRGGGHGGDFLVTALRAPGIDPSGLVEPMIADGQLDARSRSQTVVNGRQVTILVLPPYAADRAYLVTARDALLLIHTPTDELAFEFIRALP